MVANVLATQGARASTDMVLAQFSQIIPTSAPRGSCKVKQESYIPHLFQQNWWDLTANLFGKYHEI